MRWPSFCESAIYKLAFRGRADRCAWAPMQRRGDDLGHHLARSDWATRNLRREQLVSNGLGERAGPRTVPSGLLKKVRSSRNLERAWQVIEENARNSKSEEVKKEIKAFSKGSIRNIQSIYRRLVRGKFKFPPSKGVPVFKVDKDGRKNKTKFRPIVIANVESRIVQRAILEVLL